MTIGELSKKTGIPESTIRYYEKKGLIKVARNSAGRRVFDESNVEWIVFIKKLKDMGMLLKNIQKYSDLRYQGDSTISERLTMLEDHKIYIFEEQKKWNEYLNNLNNKIEICREKLV